MNRKTIFAIAGLNLATILVVVLALQFTLARANPDAPQAGAPGLISYQGYLTDINGNPLGNDQDGESVHLLFNIYPKSDTPDNGYLWQEEHETVLVKEGYFQVMLGTTTAFPDAAFNSTERWLQVTMVDGSTETHLPRQRFASVPYALQAQQALHAESVPAIGCRVIATEAQPILPMVASTGYFSFAKIR